MRKNANWTKRSSVAFAPEDTTSPPVTGLALAKSQADRMSTVVGTFGQGWEKLQSLAKKHPTQKCRISEAIRQQQRCVQRLHGKNSRWSKPSFAHALLEHLHIDGLVAANCLHAQGRGWPFAGKSKHGNSWIQGVWYKDACKALLACHAASLCATKQSLQWRTCGRQVHSTQRNKKGTTAMKQNHLAYKHRVLLISKITVSK